MDDQLIIKLFLERTEEAVHAVSDKYEKLCFSIASRILQNQEDAKECVNDTFLALWNSIPPQEPVPLMPYICKVLRNIALNKYRYNTAEKRNTHYDVSIEELAECLEGAQDVHKKLEEEELAREINRFLGGCKKTDRILFVKKYCFFMENEEIAKEMGLSKNYVNVHLHRTRERLKNHLKEGGLL